MICKQVQAKKATFPRPRKELALTIRSIISGTQYPVGRPKANLMCSHVLGPSFADSSSSRECALAVGDLGARDRHRMRLSTACNAFRQNLYRAAVPLSGNDATEKALDLQGHY